MSHRAVEENLKSFSGFWVALFLALVLFARPVVAGSNFQTLPVPLVTIYPGDKIVAGMLAPRHVHKRRIGRMPIVRHASEAVGKITKRTLLPGRPILKNGLHEPALIARGQSSTLVFRSRQLVIRTTAVALESGAVGDSIAMRNADGGRIVRGVVQLDGSVLVGGQ